MRFIFIIFVTIFEFEIAVASEKIAFIDLNFIMNNSEAGRSIKSFINNLSKEKNNDFKIIENEIKEDENELISKKNIIEESIYNKKVNEIRIRINDYKLERQNLNKNLNEKKLKFNNLLLEKLNPIISEYVEKNSITMVLPKKNDNYW